MLINKNIINFFSSDTIRINELKIFLPNFSLLLLTITNKELYSKIINIFIEIEITQIVIFLIVLSIIALSIYHSFSKSKKGKLTKGSMLAWFTYMNIYATMAYINYYSDNNIPINPFSIILSIINIFLVLGIMQEYFTKEHGIIINVADDEANIYEVITSSLIIITLIIISQYYKNNHWAITYTYCVSYTMLLSRVIMNLLRFLFNDKGIPTDSVTASPGETDAINNSTQGQSREQRGAKSQP